MDAFTCPVARSIVGRPRKCPSRLRLLHICRQVRKGPSYSPPYPMLRKPPIRLYCCLVAFWSRSKESLSKQTCSDWRKGRGTGPIGAFGMGATTRNLARIPSPRDIPLSVDVPSGSRKSRHFLTISMTFSCRYELLTREGNVLVTSYFEWRSLIPSLHLPSRRIHTCHHGHVQGRWWMRGRPPSVHKGEYEQAHLHHRLSKKGNPSPYATTLIAHSSQRLLLTPHQIISTQT